MATEIIFRDKDIEEIKKEGYKVLGDPGMLTFKTPVELFTPLKKKLEKAVKDFNSDKIPETNDYVVNINKDAPKDGQSHYLVYALEKVKKDSHQKT